MQNAILVAMSLNLTATLLRAEAAVSDSDWIMVDGRIFRCSIKDAHGQCSSPRVPQVGNAAARTNGHQPWRCTEE